MTWDAVVIGAGPAGSVTAREIARRGKSVLLLDRATFPRRKVCGCCLNRHALEALATVGLGSLPARLGAVPLMNAKLSANRRMADVALPVGAGLSREAFDSALIAEAIAAGVTFSPSTQAAIGDVIGQTRVVRAGSQELRARVVILADGLTSRVPSAIKSGSRIGAGAIFDDGPEFYAPGTIHMATGPGGYVGVVRVEGGKLDAAAAFDAKSVSEVGGIAQAAEVLLARAGWPKLPEGSWKGTPALTRQPKEIAGERWFAVGDAAGYVEPFTGEGMAWAIVGGAAVAPLAVQSWHTGLIAEWNRMHFRAIGRRQRACRAVAAVLRWPGICSLAVRLLSSAPKLAAPVVNLLNAPPYLPPVPA